MFAKTNGGRGCVHWVWMPLFDQLLHFTPLYRTRPWGGRRLETILHRELPDDQSYGESWDLVDRQDDQSVVASGPLVGTTLHDLWTRHRDDVFGRDYAASAAARFPLLIKALDCADDLSLQVHPPESVAAALHGEPKTEMWYVAHADEGSRIYAGLRAGVTRERFEQAVKDGSAAGCVHQLQARTGDSLFVPSGRLHALGRGLLIYEIQQNSDTTYRVFDWDRGKKGGVPRKMHIAEALQSIDFGDREPALLKSEGESLVRDSIFEIEKWLLPEEREIAPSGSFAIVVGLTGAFECAGVAFKPGDFFLVPAQLEDRAVRPVGENVSLLRVTVPL